MIFNMKAIPEMPYLAATGLSRPIPLERFLPACPVGVIGQYLAGVEDQKTWLLDPFGANPLLDIEAAANGRYILVAGNNPILAFILKMLASPRQKSDYLAALAEFASQMRGNERLETHLRSLYDTRCTVCHSLIQASGYLWQRGKDAPYARLYRCRECGEEGEHPITDEDLQLLAPLKRGKKLPYARALGRVLQGNQEDRPAVEEALKLYNPRALYVLFTLLNKLEGMELTIERQGLLDALMISALETGASLWPWPNTGEPPRQLTVPAVYLEKNIWLEMEKSIDLWSQPAEDVRLTVWPEMPDGPGICLFKGPIRLIEKPAGNEIGQIVCSPPRPNQALWTLSALWSAWLWGRESETSFGQVLGRRRFDWHWHTQALYHTLRKSAELAESKAGMFLSMGEPSSNMVMASCTAAICAGFSLQGVSMQSPDDPIQMLWKGRQNDHIIPKGNPQSITRTAIQQTLLKLAEPADYLTLYTAAVSSLAVNGGLPDNIQQFSQEKNSELQGIIARLFADREFLRRFENTSQELDSGTWGLSVLPLEQVPLADRVESEILGMLQEGEPISMHEVTSGLNKLLPGFMTPSNTLIEYCLRSYADFDGASSTWRLKPNEELTGREKDLQAALVQLHSLAEVLGCSLVGESPLDWEIGGEKQYRFYLSYTACAATRCYRDDSELQKVFVCPGSRAELLKYKLLRDAQFREVSSPNWHFLKFRTLKALAGRTDISLAEWQMMLDSDPLTLEENTQLRMFG